MDNLESVQDYDLWLTADECASLASVRIFSIGDLLKRTIHGDKFIFNLNLDMDKINNRQLGLTDQEVKKLERLVQKVKKFIQPGMLRQLPLKRFRKTNSIFTFFMQSALVQKNFFSNATRQLLTDKHQNVPPPGLLTRIRDGVESFDVEDIMKSCSRVLREKIPISLKSLHIEFLNRTLYSRNKLFKMGYVESPMCSICHVTATTEHCMYECSFPSFCASKIATFLDEKFHKGVPHIHLARKKLFLYNIYINELHPSAGNQVTNLILTLKKSYLQFAATERWRGWGEVVHFAQLFAHIKKVIEQRIFVNLKVDLLQDMLASLVDEFSQRP